MSRRFDDITDLLFESCVLLESSLGIESTLEFMFFVLGFKVPDVVSFLFVPFVKLPHTNVLEEVQCWSLLLVGVCLSIELTNDVISVAEGGSSKSTIVSEYS